MAQTLKQKTIGAIIWNLLDRGGQQVLQMAMVIVVANILCPDDYALVAMLAIFTAVGNLVYFCQEHGKTLEELSLEELKQVSPLFENDVYDALNLERCAMSRSSYGGPAKAETERQIRMIEDFIKARENV